MSDSAASEPRLIPCGQQKPHCCQNGIPSAAAPLGCARTEIFLQCAQMLVSTTDSYQTRKISAQPLAAADGGQVCNFSFLDVTKEVTVPRFIVFFEAPRVRSQRDFHRPAGRRTLNLWPLRTTKHPVQDSTSSFRKSSVTRAASASQPASGKRTRSRPLWVLGVNFRTSEKSRSCVIKNLSSFWASRQTSGPGNRGKPVLNGLRNGLEK